MSRFDFVLLMIISIPAILGIWMVCIIPLKCPNNDKLMICLTDKTITHTDFCKKVISTEERNL